MYFLEDFVALITSRTMSNF